MVRDGGRRRPPLPGLVPVTRNASLESLGRRTGRWRLSCNEGRTEALLLPTSGVQGGVRRPNQNRPLRIECHERNRYRRHQSQDSETYDRLVWPAEVRDAENGGARGVS